MREVVNGKKGAYKFRSFDDILADSLAFAAGLVLLGTKKGENVGIYSPSSFSWKITEYACYLSSFVMVSLYDTLGATAAEFILNHAEIKKIFVAQKMLPKLIGYANSLLKQSKEDPKRKFYLQEIILYASRSEFESDPDYKKMQDQINALGLKLHFFPEIVEAGRKKSR